jgi:hypothetical protein
MVSADLWRNKERNVAWLMLICRKTQPAPDIAKQYWRMDDNATMLDLIYAVRLDEAGHR